MIASVMVGHDGHRGAMYYLAVCPKHQGRSHGRRIVNAAETWLRERGVWKVNLLVRDDNRSVLAFYKELGYEPGETVQRVSDLKAALARALERGELEARQKAERRRAEPPRRKTSSSTKGRTAKGKISADRATPKTKSGSSHPRRPRP
jgi:RimJ/RimL family protein N-acetyltransferase